MDNIDVLDISYKRGFDHNYLVVKGNEETSEIRKNNYRIRMMLDNRINSFIHLDMKMNEGVYDYYYEISGLQPMSRVYEHREMKYEDLRNVIKEIEKAFNSAFEYMLDSEHFILNPGYIYMNVETKQMEFLYYPDYSVSLQDAFMSLAEYILDRIDHQDSDAVVVAYQLFKIVRGGCFTIKELIAVVDSVNKVENVASSTMSQEENPKFSQNFEELSNDIDAADIGNIQEEKLYEKPHEKLSARKAAPGKSIFSNIFGKSNKTSSITDSSNIIESNRIPEEKKSSLYSPENYGKTMVLVPEKTISDHILIQNQKGKEVVYNLDNLPVSIGKVSDIADIVLKDPSVSRLHCEIFAEGDVMYIKDCNSTNGTFINGMQLDAEERISLEVGDEICIGKVKFEFR